ncbi:hypothetical protein ACOME3_001780 [Neoechinorhynchus agilis]
MVDEIGLCGGLRELGKVCILSDLTMIVCSDPTEAAMYIEAFKILEHKPADALFQPQQDKLNSLDRCVDFLTGIRSVNTTDANVLLGAFQSLKNVVHAKPAELSVCAGIGPLKVKNIRTAFECKFKSDESSVKHPPNDDESHFQMRIPQNVRFLKVYKVYVHPLYSTHKCRLLSTSPANLQNVEVEVDGRHVVVPAGTTVMQACQEAGVHIPHFCYHKRLAIAGNCRMCLVEVEKNPKPVASCAMPALNGMKILTNSPFARKAREGVLEFILANHPLDCPICDQGGECDLQELTMNFGSDRSRYTDVRFTGKRATIDKNFGPLIGTSMTRCIHCTRCVRFANQVAGVPDLGVSGRGSLMQIGMYVDQLLMSELSGNVIDLCPVGALVSKPYAFTARPWELRKVESIDVTDAIGSNIKVSTRAGKLMRITPRLNEDVNEEWISDKARFSYDGLRYQRLTIPMIRQSSNSRLEECRSWKAALQSIKQQMSQVEKRSSISAIVGDLTDCETILATKDLLNGLGSQDILLGSMEKEDPFIREYRSSYTFNNGLASVEQADTIVLVNTNPRFDAPVFNARIRKAWLENQTEVALVGPKETDLTYTYQHLGNCLSDVQNIPQGKRPLIILGTHNLTKAMYEHVISLASQLQYDCADWKPFNILHNHASSVGALDLGCRPFTQCIKSEVIILLGYDQRPFVRPASCKLLIYIGHHGDINAPMADIILPGSAYTEKTATFVNTEGRVQSTWRAVSPPGLGRDDWKIIRALAETLDVNLEYNTLEEIRSRLAAICGSPYSNYNHLVKHQPMPKINKSPNIIESNIIRPTIMKLRDFYMTDSISRNSIVMAQAVQAVDDNRSIQHHRSV